MEDKNLKLRRNRLRTKYFAIEIGNFLTVFGFSAFCSLPRIFSLLPFNTSLVRPSVPSPPTDARRMSRIGWREKTQNQQNTAKWRELGKEKFQNPHENTRQQTFARKNRHGTNFNL